MSNMLTDTMHAAKHGVESAKEGTIHALESAKDGVELARESTVHSVASVLSMIVKGLAATAGIVSTLQKLDRDDGLAWFGLARRRSPLATVAIFGAGAAVGVGIALLVAPVSGANLRAMLLGGVKGEAVKVEARVHDAVKKAEPRMDGVADLVVPALKGTPEESPTNHKSTRA
jgi:hypothetical protein